MPGKGESTEFGREVAREGEGKEEKGRLLPGEGKGEKKGEASVAMSSFTASPMVYSFGTLLYLPGAGQSHPHPHRPRNSCHDSLQQPPSRHRVDPPQPHCYCRGLNRHRVVGRTRPTAPLTSLSTCSSRCCGRACRGWRQRRPRRTRRGC